MKTFAKRLSAASILGLAGVVLAWAAPELAQAGDGPGWKTAALQRYDQNKDGRLGDAEREIMRQEIFTERRRSTGRGRGMMFPPEIVAKYDTDGDGSLDDTEARTAQQALMKMFQELRRKYDSNGNGNFEPPEVAKLQADAAAGKLEDVPKFFLQMLGRGGRRPRPHDPPAGGAELELRQFDKDSDGRLNADELRAARAALQSARQAGDAPKASAAQ
jgi:hypothetical protein